MNNSNIDLNEDQVWTLATVGGFRNSLRQITAHKPTHTPNYTQYTLLNEYVLGQPEENLLKTVWDFISQDVTLSSQNRKQIVINTLGEYLCAAQACEEYLKRLTLHPDERKGINNPVYADNAKILSSFYNDFAHKLSASLNAAQSVFSPLTPVASVEISDNLDQPRSFKR